MEPGIYIPNLVGVQVEENVAVMQDGAEVPIASPRGLRSL